MKMAENYQSHNFEEGNSNRYEDKENVRAYANDNIHNDGQ